MTKNGNIAGKIPKYLLVLCKEDDVKIRIHVHYTGFFFFNI